MKNKPKVSVVIITHDRYAYLLEAICSATEQHLLPTEIIVVDDGSHIPIQKQLDKDNFNSHGIPLYVIRIDDCGPATARNIGASRVNGELIAFLDDDDKWKEDYLEKCVYRLQQEKSQCVISWLTCFDGKSYWPGKAFPENYENLDLYARNHGFVGSNFVITKDAYKAVGGFDESLLGSEDKDFLIRLIANDVSITVLSEQLVLHRVHPKTQASGKSSFHYMQVYGKQKFYNKHSKNMSKLTKWRLRTQSAYFMFRGARHVSERLAGLLEFIVYLPLGVYSLISARK